MRTQVLVCRSNPIAPDPRVEKISHVLSNAGYRVQLLGWDRTASLPTEAQSGPVTIHRLPLQADFGNGLANLPNLLHWQVGLYSWLHKHHNEYDIIHACDFDTVLPALFCRRLWGKKVIYDIFDFYADHLRATPTLLKKIIRAVDLRVIGLVDALILADDSRYEQIKGSNPKLSVVIYNSPEDTPSPVPLPGEPATGSGLHLAYVGLLQVERGLFEILEVLQRHLEWTLDLAGFGGDEERISAIASQMPNVTWHGRVSYETALRLSSTANVLFATYDPSIPNHRFSSPNKVFEAMMLGKPIIVARGTNMDRIIEQADCGLVIDYGSTSALEVALCQLQADPELRCHLGENARRAYETTYSWSVMKDRLLNLYATIARTIVNGQ